MSRKKYTYILLFLFVILKCVPGKYVRQEHSIKTQTDQSSNYSYYNWSYDEPENNNKSPDLTYRDDNYSYNKKSDIHSKKFITSKNQIQQNDKKTNSKIITNSRKRQKMPLKKVILKNPEKRYKENNYQKLKLYKVKSGDNLLKLSKKFNVDLNELIRINEIKDIDKIYKGMIIKLPEDKIESKSVIRNSAQVKSPDFSWPVKHIYKTKRDGLDGVKSIGILIVSDPDTVVFSSAEGIVTKVGHMRGFGKYIIVRHINKYLTIYSNLKEIKVIEGEKIPSGKSIGKIEGDKLHFQIGHLGKPEDPFKYLSSKS